MLDEITAYLDGITGIKGTLGYLVIVLIILLGHFWANAAPSPKSIDDADAKEEEEEKEPPRNFTIKQLQYFDGKKDESSGEDKPVYLSLNGTVFDVSDGRNFYGPDGPYELFAGHECGVAMAKLSFDTNFLDDLKGCATLNAGEKMELEGWIEKFTYYRCYPIKGRLVSDDQLPDPERILTKEELAKNDGTRNDEKPEGYATAPIYLGAGDKVYDTSFGGVTFYGPDGGYHRFAGKDASRALAKMSFDPADIENTDTSDLDEKQQKTLADWIKTFGEKKGYPVVGRLR